MIKILSIVLMILVVSNARGYVQAQDTTRPNGFSNLTSQQIETAIEVNVSNLSMIKRSSVTMNLNDKNIEKYGKVYKLANCDISDLSKPCFISTYISKTTSDSKSRASTGTIQCVVPFYNGVGVELGRLQQNVYITFHGNAQRLPATVHTANSNGTYMYGLAYWSQISDPVVGPGYGIRVKRYSGTMITSVVSGIRQWHLTGGTESFATTLIVNDSSIMCI